MKKSMKINAAKYGLRLITFETGHYDMCGYFKDNERDFSSVLQKGLNDCTGGYNNFMDLKGFFQFSLFFS